MKVFGMFFVIVIIFLLLIEEVLLKGLLGNLGFEKKNISFLGILVSFLVNPG